VSGGWPRRYDSSDVQSAASDWAATRLAVAIEHEAIALAEPEETQQHILPARELLRPRP
jgi:hypothetical protein